MDSNHTNETEEPKRIINHEEPVKGMFRVGPIIRQIRLAMIHRELERATEAMKRRQAISD